MFLLGTLVFVPALKAAVRTSAAEMLHSEFGGAVEFRSFEVTFLPKMRVVAQGVLVGNDRNPPLVQIGTVETASGLIPWHLQSVKAQGVWLNVPTATASSKSSKSLLPITADNVLVTNARIDVLPSAGNSEPLHFNLAQLHISHLSLNRPSSFNAVLKSSEPRAVVQISGQAGPWNTANPSLTVLQGSYTTQAGDLSSLGGLSGSVVSKGQFRGSLQRIAIAGDLDAPDFGLRAHGFTEPIQASFQASLNAADSSLDVQRIAGKLQQTPFQGAARIENVQDQHLRKVSSDVSIPEGRLEDVLPLFVNARTSPMNGPFQLRAKVALAGDQNLIGALEVDGDFSAPHARFASLDLRDQIRKLTRKASGHPKDRAAGTSMFSMQGHVELRSGTVHLRDLRLHFPDAGTRLNGTYQLASERIDLHGELWMAAKLSNTTTGAKRLLLKIADPFFRNKRGGARLPVRITGTESEPHFALNLAPPMLTARSRRPRVLFSH